MKHFSLTKSLAILAASLLLTACASGSMAAGDSYNGYKADADYGYSMNESVPTGSGFDMIAPAEPEADKDADSADPLEGRKIVRTMHISAETKAFPAATAKIEQLCAELGGYIESSSRSGGSIRYDSSVIARSAKYTLRVPAEKLDAFRAGLGGDINVVDESSNIDDITDQYYDIDVRLSTLRVEEERLLAMLEKANDLEYMLTLEQRLSEVRYEIETMTATLRRYDSRVAYSTVHLNLDEVVEYTEVIEAPKTFGEELGIAFRESWSDFAANCREFAVSFVYAIPTLLVVIAIGVVSIGGLILLARRGGKRGGKQADNRNADEKNGDERK